MPEHTRFTWEKEVIKQRFNGEALRVLWTYASHSDADSLITFPTIRQVADATGISVEKVGKYRTALLDAGWLAESDEKTSRGNAKLMLAVGEDIDRGYLGEKRAVSKKSMDNLIPAAKQKKQAQSLDIPDKAGLENADNAGLENPDTTALDYPDVTTSELNNHSLTTNNNHASADANAVAIRKDGEMEDSTLGHSCLIDGSTVSQLEGLTYFLTTEGIVGPAKVEMVYPVSPNVDSRDAAVAAKPKPYMLCTPEEKAERDAERLLIEAEAKARRAAKVAV